MIEQSLTTEAIVNGNQTLVVSQLYGDTHDRSVLLLLDLLNPGSAFSLPVTSALPSDCGKLGLRALLRCFLSAFFIGLLRESEFSCRSRWPATRVLAWPGGR